MTIAEAIERATLTLRAAGVATPERDAELLLRHVLGFDRAKVVVEGRSALPQDATHQYEGLVRERAARRPLQHLVGTQAFWKHEFRVGPDVLIPRPETELLVEESLRFLSGREGPVVVDVGTGSGCIALSLAAERRDALVHAIDISKAALVVARANALRMALAERVTFHEGDLLEPLTALRGCVDLVVSNPPYVDSTSRGGLDPEVRDGDPAVALFPPGGPCSLYGPLATQALALLRPGGGLIVEVGAGMAAEVQRIVTGAGFVESRVLPDLQGILRALVARRS